MDNSSMFRVEVSIPNAPYDVIVGGGALGLLADLDILPPKAERIALVTSASVQELYGDQVMKGLLSSHLPTQVIVVPDGEEAKSLATVESCWEAFAVFDLNRNDVVVALGGGVVGDMAGFAAATWDRGVSVVQVPTTLLAQVDSAIGGKTGVNLSHGKNLVGAFHQPLVVIADTSTLPTLPGRERLSGLAEVVKYGFIADPTILDTLERSPEAAVDGDPELITDLVLRSVIVKAEIVASDEREAGRRSLLNYGHTVGHAIETLSSYREYRHGEAVALGMVFAARLGERLGVSASGLAMRTETLLERLGLPTGDVEIDVESVWQIMRRDKKAHRGVRFVLCESPGKAVLVDQPEEAVINEVLLSLANDSASGR